MNRLFRFILVIALLFPPAHLYAANNKFNIHGYWKSFFIANSPPNFESFSGYESPKTASALNNTLRLKSFREISSKLSFNGAYSISPRFSEKQIILFSSIYASNNTYRASDLNSMLFDNEHGFEIYQNLDRFYFKYETSKSDTYIGRQAIAWGSAKTVNPTDIILPFRFDEIDKEERTGVDAARIRFASGLMNELDLGIVAGKDLIAQNGAIFARNKFSLLNSDVSFILIDYSDNLLAGMDVSRSIGGAGFWLETAYTYTKLFNDYENNKNNNYLRLSTGFDYTFNSDTYGFIEYHFSGSGKTDPKDYYSNLSNPAFSEGGVFLLGKNYLMPGISYQISPLITSGLQSIINIDDGSLFLSPSAEYNVSENLYLSLGAFLGFGRQADVSTNYYEFNSEFGSYSNLLYFSFRAYF